jgi:hypothetical protein
MSKRLGRRPLLLTLLIAAVVAGIFGMHGLVCSSGTDAADHAMSMASGQEVPAHLDMGTPGDTRQTAATASPASHAVPAPVDGSGMGDMLMLCLAVLTAIAGALLGLLVLHRYASTALWSPRGAGPLARGVFRPLPTGPPSAWRFSVIRC